MQASSHCSLFRSFPQLKMAVKSNVNAYFRIGKISSSLFALCNDFLLDH